jgi:putative hemin transport protein
MQAPRQRRVAGQVTEGEMVAVLLGTVAVRLDDNAADLLFALSEVGRCKALTRNACAVSELRGRYGGIELDDGTARVLGENIELCATLEHWRHAFAIDQPHSLHTGERARSIQVFDAHGTAVHKVYLEPDGDAKTWDAIVATRTVTARPVLDPLPRRRAERSNDDTDRARLRLTGPNRAQRVANEAIDQVLHTVAATGDPVRIQVGNRGCTQAFSGAVERVLRQGPWLSVLDRDFKLHLRADQIASSWVVRTPTRSGTVTSLELFDASGMTIAQVFCHGPDPDRIEGMAWRTLLDALAPIR